MKKFFLFLSFALLCSACNQTGTDQQQADFISTAPKAKEPDFEKIFSTYAVRGTFVLHQLNADHWMVHNAERAAIPVLPASTFKIPNSLIALESGVVQDEKEVFAWDGVERSQAVWNKNHNLRSGIQYSVVWLYQELARKIGQQKMQHWVDAFEYGNQTIGNKVDEFWLTGPLKIRPKEQIVFLEKLYRDQLPSSKKNMAIVKDIMIREQNANYILRAKTGWANVNEPNLGWYIGWLEEGGEVYFFAMNIDINKTEDAAKRTAITQAVFREIGLLKK